MLEVDEKTQQRKIIDQSKKIQLGRIILIRYSLVSQVKVDHLARIIIDSCTLEHSDFQGTTFSLVTDGEAVKSSENNVIRFRLDQVNRSEMQNYKTFIQESPSISLKAFGNLNQDQGLTNFNIKCRLYLCMRQVSFRRYCMLNSHKGYR